MAEFKYVARSRLLVLQRDPNEGEELERMNRNKVWAPYRYPESMFLAMAAIRCLTGASHGALEGPARQAPGDDGTPRHARTCRKINGIKVGIRGGMVIASSSKRAVRTAADPSGLQPHNRGEWITKKWKLKRGFARARMLADVDTHHVLALKVTDEKTGGAPVFETLVTEAVAALDRAAARGEARGKEAEAAEAEEKEEAVAAIAAEAMCSASEEVAAARGRRRRRRDGPRAGAGGVRLCRRDRGGRGGGGESRLRRRRVRVAQVYVLERPVAGAQGRLRRRRVRVAQERRPVQGARDRPVHQDGK